MKAIGIIALAALTACSASAREKVKGNGDIITKTISVSDYQRIDLGSGIEGGNTAKISEVFGKKKVQPQFHYTQASGKSTLEVTTDSNLFDRIKFEVVGGTLVIRSQDPDAQLYPTQLDVMGSSSALKGVNVIGVINFLAEKPVKAEGMDLEVSGVGNIVFSNLDCQSVSCNVSGVGSIELSGEAQSGKYDVSGVGHIHAYDFAVDNLTADVSGVGGIQCDASKTLKASTSGVGNIRYTGTAQVSTNSSGLGNIKQK
ncbi:MAG: DUF2807 domain-containing protein [Tannerella sp.]|jgi:hypothetical protein|nr:DUF2807 domain-containing protein [Tannerella sp.]